MLLNLFKKDQPKLVINEIKSKQNRNVIVHIKIAYFKITDLKIGFSGAHIVHFTIGINIFRTDDFNR
jgi:hypothetical protein